VPQQLAIEILEDDFAARTANAKHLVNYFLLVPNVFHHEPRKNEVEGSVIETHLMRGAASEVRIAPLRIALPGDFDALSADVDARGADGGHFA
jgi:hypothetical protein